MDKMRSYKENKRTRKDLTDIELLYGSPFPEKITYVYDSIFYAIFSFLTN